MHMRGRLHSTPVRLRRQLQLQALPAEFLRWQDPRARRRAPGGAGAAPALGLAARAYHADASTFSLPSPTDVTPIIIKSGVAQIQP